MSAADDPLSENADDRSEISDSQDGPSAAAFGARVRAVARLNGLTSADLVRQTGIKKQTMSGYWNGKSHVSAENAFDLADALEVNPRWLVTGKGSREAPIEMSSVHADEEAVLLQDFRRMESWQRAALLSMAGTILGRNVVELEDLRGQRFAAPANWHPDDESATLHSKVEEYRAEPPGMQGTRDDQANDG